MSTTNTTPPEDIPDYSTGGGGGAFDAEAVMSTDSNSSSEIAWAVISFLILWGLGLVLLGTVLALACQDNNNKRRRDATTTNASAAAIQEPDVEASKKTNQHEQQEEQQEADDATLVVLVSSSSDRSSSSRLSSLAIPLFSAITAFCISIVPHTSCEYLELSEDDNNDLLSLGLWKVAYVYGSSRATEDLGGEHKCYSNFRTADFQVDTALTVARVAAILATTIGGICMLVLLYYARSIASSSSSAKLVGGGRLGRRLVWPLLVAAFCQGLTLSIYASDQCQTSASCDVDMGALSAITSTFYWFLCAVATTTILR